MNANTADIATISNSANALNGIAGSNFARLNFANPGNISGANFGAAGSLSVGGNAQQSAASFGLPKAIAYVSQTTSGSPTIPRCYNGLTGASTSATCGFTVTEPLGPSTGVFRINFGFSVDGRFAFVTPLSESTPLRNIGANVRFNSGNLEVFTFETNNLKSTQPNDFMVVVY